MSPVNDPFDELAARFPRVSGDEPPLGRKDLVKVGFSPRERG